MPEPVSVARGSDEGGLGVKSESSLGIAGCLRKRLRPSVCEALER